MSKEKRLLNLLTLGLALLIITAIFFGYNAYQKGEMNSGNIIYLLFPLVIIIFFFFVIKRNYRDINKGLPVKDERSKKIMNKSAAIAYFISIYWLVFISFFQDIFAPIFNEETLSASRALSLGIIGMAIIFFISWAYYMKKDDIK